MTEIDVYKGSTLPAKVEYSKMLAASGLLPAAYRERPANILWAMEYGSMLGLAPMAAITGVHVIEGKPTASAGLISALVRRAGHKLRVKGDSKSATCQIVRSDDPGYTFEVTFTMEDAAAAGLAGKPVWRNYAASMLKARAITQCARDACEEALYGLHYTPEELGAEVDADGEIVGEAPPAARPQAPQGEAPVDAEVVDETIPEPGGGTQRVSEVPAGDPWYSQPAAQTVTDEKWADGIHAEIEAIASREDGGKVWAKIVTAYNDGDVTAADRRALEGMVTAKVAEFISASQDTAEGSEAA